MKKTIILMIVISMILFGVLLTVSRTFEFSNGGEGWVHQGPSTMIGKVANGTNVTLTPTGTISSYHVVCEGTTGICYSRTATHININADSFEGLNDGALAGSGHE